MSLGPNVRVVVFAAVQSIVCVTFLGAAPAFAQDDDLALRIESKIHYRNSEQNRFAVSFPFPAEALPVGESTAFLETVDAGDHVEVSSINVVGRWRFSPGWALHGKLEIVDLYDRNPTSSDQKADVDTLFIRYGAHQNALQLPESSQFYAQVGKFPKFERQRARRTESYGLVSTAFNRFEDSGIEVGFDLPMGFYGRASYTTGNPVFFRDPNALAGDNGTEERRLPPNNPDPELKSGIVILYDAEVESFELGSEAEIGAAWGYRWQSRNKGYAADFMMFSYERKLAQDRSLHGTFYGTDLDVFDLGEVPGAGGIRLPAQGDEKTESGANLWLNLGGFAVFAQYVDQDMASLGRTGKEIELSYVFDGPMKISPVLRYSKLDNDFVGSPLYPAPSVWWDWDKIDYGINVQVNDALRITLEYADNTFVRAGRDESNNETLVTFRWQHNP